MPPPPLHLPSHRADHSSIRDLQSPFIYELTPIKRNWENKTSILTKQKLLLVSNRAACNQLVLWRRYTFKVIVYQLTNQVYCTSPLKFHQNKEIMLIFCCWFFCIKRSIDISIIILNLIIQMTIKSYRRQLKPPQLFNWNVPKLSLDDCAWFCEEID